MIETLDKAAVEHRIADWAERLEKLYAEVRGWARALGVPAAGILAGRALQNVEAPMIQHRVPPRMLPTLAILLDMNQVEFSPGAIWTREGEGSLGVSTSIHSYVLSDARDKEEGESRWMISTSRFAEPRPFGPEVFAQLLRRQELAA